MLAVSCVMPRGGGEHSCLLLRLCLRPKLQQNISAHHQPSLSRLGVAITVKTLGTTARPLVGQRPLRSAGQVPDPFLSLCCSSRNAAGLLNKGGKAPQHKQKATVSHPDPFVEDRVHSVVAAD